MIIAFICYIIRKIYESSFQHNKQCIFWTSELGVMAILVEVALAVGGYARMKEDSSISPSYAYVHTQLGGMFLV